MAQPTSKMTRFVGSIYTGTTPPSVAELGRSLQAGDVYVDIEGGQTQLCVYDGSAWACTADLTVTQPTSTSTTTTTSTTTSTSTTTT